MSTRAAEFVSTLQNDPELAQKLQSAGDADERRKVVTDAGFGDVSGDDVKAELSGNDDSGELSEDELGAASGAGGFGLNLGIPGLGGGGFTIDW